MNNSSQLPKNPEMDNLKENLKLLFPVVDFLKEWPASKPNEKKTDVIWKAWEDYIKWFTKTWEVLWRTEKKLIELFNQFSEKSKSSFSGPDILDEGKTEDGWFYFLMKDAKIWGKEELDFSKMNPEEIMKLYNEYRQTFDEFEKYSNGKVSTESNPTLQKLYSLSKNNILFNFVWNSILKAAIAKKYKNKINERISNGQGNVRACGVDMNRERINRTLDRLLSKVKNLDFEYNFWRFWTWHVFSDGTNHKFVDFDNVSYQIKGTELIWIMWSNVLLNSKWKYKSYDEWKIDYDGWYNKLMEVYKDDDVVKLLLFVKLVWTVFEDYWHLIFEREIWDKGKNPNKFEEIRKWVQRNYRALEELME